MAYVPEKRDVVWINLNPTRGHEQKGLRPALILSPAIYNSKSVMAIVLPITSQTKGYPFEVKIADSKIKGSILADHIRCVDWKIRKCKKITRVSSSLMKEVLEKIKLLIEI